jgi:phospholipase C
MGLEMFAQSKKAIKVILEKGDVVLYRLPPMSQGNVAITVFDLGAIPTDPDHPDSDEADVDAAPAHLAKDLELNLIHSDHLSVPGTSDVSAESLWVDDLWRLRVKRKATGHSSPPHYYRFLATYPSQLPIIERRIPISFFRDGFALNYNQQQYVQILFDDNYLTIRLRSDLFWLYGQDVPSPIPFDIKIPFVSIPVIIRNFATEQILFGMGAGQLPNGGGNTAFILLRADVKEGGTIDVDHAHTEFPAFSLEIRLYLRGDPITGKLGFVVKVIPKGTGVDDILEKIDFTKEIIENSTISMILNFFQRWLVGGNYKLFSVGYDPSPSDLPQSDGTFEPASGDLIVRYVGPSIRLDPDSQPPVVTTDPGNVGTDPNAMSALTVKARGANKSLIVPLTVDITNAVTPATFDLHVDRIHNLIVPFVAHSLVFDKWSDGANTFRREFASQTDTILTVSYIPRLFDVPLEDPDELPAPIGFGVDPLPPHPIGNLAKIDHIVVLMQENRSFDTVLGYLSRDKIKPEVNGLAPLDSPEYENQKNVFEGVIYRPEQAPVTSWNQQIPSPGHGSDDVADQINDGKMDRFVANFALRTAKASIHLVMQYYAKGQLKKYDEIVEKFAICDNWNTSFAGGTLPNRFVFLTGRLNKNPRGGIEEDNPDPITMVPSQTPTIFDYLNEHNVSWRVFEHGYSFMRMFAKYTFDTTNILPFNDPIRGFEATAREGQLPSVTLIEPDYIELPPGNDDHAPADMAAGQILVDRIVTALVNSPQWRRTLLIITYDEHGGFYDHQTPPLNNPSLGDSRKYMGPRVPAFMVSPLVRPGKVFKTQFDHTTIGATILRRFCRPHPPKVSPRLDAARDLREVLELANSPSVRRDFGSFSKPLAQSSRHSKARKSSRNLLSNDDGDMGDSTGTSTLIGVFSGSARRGDPIGIPNDPEQDFHWFLSLVRLITGQPPTFDK